MKIITMKKTEEKAQAINCPDCRSEKVYRYGPSPYSGYQRYLCRVCGRSFQLTYAQAGYDPVIRAEALALHKDGYTQTAISAQLGLSAPTIRAITKGHSRGRQLPACPYCNSRDTWRFGKDRDGTQRFRCKSCLKTYQGKNADNCNPASL